MPGVCVCRGEMLVRRQIQFWLHAVGGGVKQDSIYFLFQTDRRTLSMSESMASTVTAPSEEDRSSSDDDRAEDDDSDTASAPSPTPLQIEEGV